MEGARWRGWDGGDGMIGTGWRGDGKKEWKR